MATTVRDAAALLGVLAGDGTDYASYAVEGRLAGKRIGRARGRRTGATAATPTTHAERAVRAAGRRGRRRSWTTPTWTRWQDFDGQRRAAGDARRARGGLARYLATRAGDGPRTLADVVAFNREHADVELAHFGQSLFEQALEGPGVDSPEYAEARARCLAHGRDDGIDAVLRAHDLDALVTPSYAPAMPDRPGQRRGATRLVHRPPRRSRATRC